MQSKVEICGVNTAKLPQLKNEETMALLQRVKEGDAEFTRLLEVYRKEYALPADPLG